MTFEEVLHQALALLQRQGRVSYRALKRQFSLDDAELSCSTRVRGSTVTQCPAWRHLQQKPRQRGIRQEGLGEHRDLAFVGEWATLLSDASHSHSSDPGGRQSARYVAPSRHRRPPRLSTPDASPQYATRSVVQTVSG
jgi:hypothetical protein